MDEIQHAFAKKRRCRQIAAFAIVCSLLVVVPIERRLVENYTSFTLEQLAIIFIGITVLSVVVMWRIWRCPNCEAPLGKGMNPGACPSCQYQLQ